MLRVEFFQGLNSYISWEYRLQKFWRFGSLNYRNSYISPLLEEFANLLVEEVDRFGSWKVKTGANKFCRWIKKIGIIRSVPLRLHILIILFPDHLVKVPSRILAWNLIRAYRGEEVTPPIDLSPQDVDFLSSFFSRTDPRDFLEENPHHYPIILSWALRMIR